MRESMVFYPHEDGNSYFNKKTDFEEKGHIML